MHAEVRRNCRLAKPLSALLAGVGTAAVLSVGALAQTAVPLPPVVINADTPAEAPSAPQPQGSKSGPVTGKSGQPGAPPVMTIGEIVAANLETPDKICPAVTPIISADPGTALDLIETAKQRPKHMELLAQCLSQIQSAMKTVNPEGARTVEVLVATAPPGFQAAYAVALANASSGDAPGADSSDGGGSSGGGGGSTGGSASAGDGGGGGGTSGGGGTGFGGFASGGAIGGGGGNFGIPVSRSGP